MLLAYKWCFIWQIKLIGCPTAKHIFLKSPSQYLQLSGPVHATQIWWHEITSALHLVVTTYVFCMHFSLLWLCWHNPPCAVGRVTSSCLLLADRIGLSKCGWRFWYILPKYWMSWIPEQSCLRFESPKPCNWWLKWFSTQSSSCMQWWQPVTFLSGYNTGLHGLLDSPKLQNTPSLVQNRS